MQEPERTVANATEICGGKKPQSAIRRTGTARLSAVCGLENLENTAFFLRRDRRKSVKNIKLYEVPKNREVSKRLFVQTNEFAIWQEKVAKKS